MVVSQEFEAIRWFPLPAEALRALREHSSSNEGPAATPTS
jgi:hypothetical protein